MYWQNRKRGTDVENKHRYQRGKRIGGMNWEAGIDTYMLMILCIKQMVNENPLYGTENSTQCFAMT